MPVQKPTILIIVGITGDLAQRKLLPAIGQMAAFSALPEQFRVIGITRRSDIQINDLLKKATNQDYLQQRLELFSMDLTDIEGYKRLKQRLQEIDMQLGVPAQRLFYLSVPPQVSNPIIELLGASGLAAGLQTKLLLEKPFGVDLESATGLVEHIQKYFLAEQVYRIDHYLAKGAAQNIVVFRQGNSLFKRSWNAAFIERIEIVASEQIGVEGRAVFYEQTGALRDLVQSHLLQLAALVLMRPPGLDQLDQVPRLRFEALRQLQLPARPIPEIVRRGQYEGYREEVGNAGSVVETLVSVECLSTDPEWKGVPIILRTGKAMDRKSTEIRILYKKDLGFEANELILRLQPDEGVEVCIWTRKPGYEQELSRHSLKFSFKEHYQTLPEAYEQVLFDAMNSDHRLFTSSEEVLETWRIIDPIQRAWSMAADDLMAYPKGASIDQIFSDNEHKK